MTIEKAPIIGCIDCLYDEDEDSSVCAKCSDWNQRNADHQYYLKQFAKWLKNYDNYSQYYSGTKQPVRRHDIPNADIEALLKDAGEDNG